MLENFVAEISGFLYWVLNIIVNRTIRFKIINLEIIDKTHEQGKQVIFASWHGQFFPAIYFYRHRKLCLLPITSLRGKILVSFAKRYGHRTIPYPEFGSPGERIQSVQKILNTIKEGFDLALVVDGPPKPEYHKVNPGVLYFSKKMRCPLIPVGIYMERTFTMSWRWDKFEIPLPGSTVVIALGEPLEVPAELDVSELGKKTKELEERLYKTGGIAKNALQLD